MKPVHSGLVLSIWVFANPSDAGTWSDKGLEAAAAYECAALSDYTALDSPAHGETSRLFLYGYRLSKEYVESELSDSKILKLMNHIPESPKADFFAGMIFGEVSKSVEQKVGENHIIGTENYQLWAEAEFRAKNCTFIGRK